MKSLYLKGFLIKAKKRKPNTSERSLVLGF